MRQERPSCRDIDTLLHRHLFVPAGIWAAMVIAACAAAWFAPDEPPAIATSPIHVSDNQTNQIR